MAASSDIQEWSEASIRATILSEIQSGQAYTVLSEVIERIANETFKAFEVQASQITVQQRQIETTRAETKDDIEKTRAEITLTKDGIQQTYDELQPMACHLQLVLHRFLATIAALFGKPREHCLGKVFVSIQ